MRRGITTLRGWLHRTFDQDARELLRLGGVAFGLKFTGAFVSFALTVVLARLLGAEGTGLYYLALSATSFAVVLSRFGLDNALLRFTAAGADQGDWPTVQGVYRSGTRLAVAAGVAVTLLMVSLASPLALGLFSKPTLEAPLRWMALAILPASLFMLLAELLKGLKKIFAATLVQSVLLPVSSLLAVALLVPQWGVQGAAGSYVLGTLATCAAGLYCWKRATPMLRGLRTHFSIRKLLGAAAPLLVIALLQSVMQVTTTVVLGIWRSSGEVGTYGVASRTAQLTGFFLVAVNSIAAPKFAAQHRRGDRAALARTARLAAASVTLAASPLLIFFLLAPELTMRIFGADFAGGGTALMILTVGQLVNLMTGSVGYLLMMSGHERALMWWVLLASLVQIGASLALVPRMGVIGAAAASAGSLILLNLGALLTVRRLLGITVIPTFRRQHDVV